MARSASLRTVFMMLVASLLMMGSFDTFGPVLVMTEPSVAAVGSGVDLLTQLTDAVMAAMRLALATMSPLVLFISVVLGVVVMHFTAPDPDGAPFDTDPDAPEPVDVPDVAAPYSRDQYARGVITLATYEERVVAALDDDGGRIWDMRDDVDGLGRKRCAKLSVTFGHLERLAYHDPANVAWKVDGIGEVYAEKAVDAARERLPADEMLTAVAEADAEVATA